MKTKSFFFIIALVAIVFSSCQKDHLENAIPTLTEQDRLEIWQLSDPSDMSIGGLKSSGLVQWSPYPYPYFVVYQNEAFYRRYFVVYDDLTYSVYDRVDLQNGEWEVVEYQALIFTGSELPGFNYVEVISNLGGQNLPVNVTIPPKYFEGKLIGNVSYEINDATSYGAYLLFDNTVLSAEVANLGTAAKWTIGETQVDLDFTLPSPPNATMWLPFTSFDSYTILHVYWEDLNGYNYKKLSVSPGGFTPALQLSANSSTDISYVSIMPHYLDGHSWVPDWSYFGNQYQITSNAPNEYSLQYLPLP